MAKKDRIDLIKEFEGQKDNDYIVLTTYCFDPIFFDNYIFKKIRQNNPNAEIIVLIDAEQYEKSFDFFTSETGKSYHLLPIYINRGVFHPKIFIFLSDSDKKLTSYVGSGNLTIPGLTKNAEIVSKTEYNLENSYLDIKIISDFINGLINGFIHDKKVTGTLQDIRDYLEPFQGSDYYYAKYKIIHNLNQPIIQQLLDEFDNTNFEEILLLAPFLSKSPVLIDKLAEDLNFHKITLILPKNNHTPIDIQKYYKSASKHNIELDILTGEFKERNRIFHSKIMYFTGPKNYLLIGSANLTISALLETSTNGNIECSILFEDLEAHTILDDIKTSPFDVNSIECMEEPSYDRNTLLKIYSVDFDEDRNILDVETEKIDADADITLTYEDGRSDSYKDHLKDGKFTKYINKSIPTSLTINCANKQARRRIFYDRLYFLRKFSKSSSISINEVNSKISHDASISLSEILSILGGIFKKQPEVTTSRQQVVKGKKLKVDSPSKAKSFLNSSLKNLIDIHYFGTLKNSLEDNLDEYHNDKQVSKEYQLYQRYSKRINENTIFASIKKINELIKYYAVITESDTNEIIGYQSLLIYVFLIFTNEYRLIPVLEEFREILKENVDNIVDNKISRSAGRMFFCRLLTMDYVFKYNDTYNFKVDLFSYEDFVNEKTYYKIRNNIENLLDSQFTEEFNDNDFNYYYAGMASYIFNSNNMDDGFNYTLDLIKTSKGDFESVLTTLIKILLDGTDDYPRRLGFSEEARKKAGKVLNM